MAGQLEELEEDDITVVGPAVVDGVSGTCSDNNYKKDKAIINKITAVGRMPSASSKLAAQRSILVTDDELAGYFAIGERSHLRSTAIIIHHSPPAIR